MLKHEATLERLQKINIQGGLLPAVTLLDDLVRFLNDARTAQGKRIVVILEKMLELEDMTKPISPEEPMIAALEWKRTDPKKFKIHWEIAKRSTMLQHELSKYRFTPRAEVVMGSGGKGPSQWAAWWIGNDRAKWERHLKSQVRRWS